MTDDKKIREKGGIELGAEDLDKIVGGASAKITSSSIRVERVEEQQKFVYSPKTSERK